MRFSFSCLLAFCLVCISPVVLSHTDSNTSDSTAQPTIEARGLSEAERNYLRQLDRLRVPLIDNQPPLTFIEEGQPRGYLNELLNLVSNRLGLEIERFPSSYTDSITALKNGDADLLNDYSSNGDLTPNILETPAVLLSPFVAVALTDTTPIRGIDDLRGKRIVTVKGFQQTRALQAVRPDFNILQVDSISDAYRALRSRDADYYIDNATHAGYYLQHHMINDLQIVGELPTEELGKLQLYFAVGQQHPLLHSAIVKTINQLYASGEIHDLRSTWLQDAIKPAPLHLTFREKQWLEAHPHIRVVLDPDWAPVEYRNKSGDYEGISLDYLDRIEKLLNIKLDVVKGLSWQDGVDAVKNKQADMFASVARTDQRESYLLFTRPYIDMPIRIFARNDVSYIGNLENLSDKRIAVVEGYAIQDWLQNDHPHLNIVGVPTPAAGLSMVARGEIDIFIGNLVTATYYLGKYGLSNVRVAGETPYSNNQSMAVRNDWPLFLGILQKALDAIPQSERKTVYNRWMSIRFERAENYTLLGWVILASIILLLAALYWNRSLNQLVRNRTHELAESELRFRSFFERNLSVMMIIEPDSGNIVEANHSAVNYYGYPRHQLLNMSISDINTMPKETNAEFRRRAKEERQNHFTFEHRLASGELRDVEVYSTPIVSGNRQMLFSIVHDITERKHAEQQIARQAHYDALTGLPNRVLAMDRLYQMMHEADRSQHKVAVMFIDLDDFKKINDTLGHDVGDMLLVDAAERISGAIRDADTVGRLGGDEFIVLIGNLVDGNAVVPVAEKILDCFRNAFHIQSRDLMLTASIGIAIYADDGDNTVALLRNADSAMYHAKEHGRNTFAFFTEAMNQSVSRRLSLEEQMGGALERNEFYLCYQPKIEVSSNKIVGVEALLRWNNATLGPVSPGEFIPVAEQSGMIVPIGEFVLREALQVLSECHRRFGKHITMAINLSPRQFRDPRLVDFIEDSVAQANIPWHSLELEITESVLMTGLSYIDQAVATLDARGAGLAMDDFGTGYSSLGYLRQFPFDVLKIDRSFINDITVDNHDLELVNAIISMAHSLGMQVVAEGVETQEQLNILAAQGCDLVQGFLLGKPILKKELFDLLNEPLIAG